MSITIRAHGGRTVLEVPTGKDYGKLPQPIRADVAAVLTGRDFTYDDKGRTETPVEVAA